jgi:hypothetical protein
MTGGMRRAALVVAAMAAALLAFAGVADAAVYWPDYGQVSRVNVDGSVFQEGFISRPQGAPSSEVGCAGVAVTATKIYWSFPAAGEIAEANLDGTEPNFAFITGLANPCGVAVDSGSIYWTEFEGGTIGRANLTGGEVDRNFVTGLKRPCGVGVDDGSIYWSAEAAQPSAGGAYQVARRPLAGGIPEGVYATSDAEPCGLAFDSEHVYWGSYGETIGRAGLNGSAPEPSFIAGLDRPAGIAVYGPSIYWGQNDPRQRTIATTELLGSHQPRVIFELPGGVPEGIAVDSVVVPPPPAPPQATYEVGFGKVHHGKRTPVTYVPLLFPQGGSFEVAVPRSIRDQVVAPGSHPGSLPAAGRRLVKLTPAGGRAARSLRRRLDRNGKAWISVRVLFKATDGSHSIAHKRVSLLAR